MKKTTTYEFNLPEGSDPADIAKINENMTLIDRSCCEHILWDRTIILTTQQTRDRCLAEPGKGLRTDSFWLPATHIKPERPVEVRMLLSWRIHIP